MRKIVYMMNFKGRRSQASSGSKLRTTSSSTSCVVSTVVRTTGVETDCRASPGELAFLESESRLTGPGLFEEDGVIAFGDNSDHLLRFSTLGQGSDQNIYCQGDKRSVGATRQISAKIKGIFAAT